MELRKVIEEIEALNCKVILLDYLETKGRYLFLNNEHFIFLRSDTTDIEKINILLHEKHHLLNDDSHNSLAHIDTFSQRIETKAEKGRILDFMSLINSEYPIDEQFNYHDYIKNAGIPSTYEVYVQEIATNFFNENKKITLSKIVLFFYFRTNFEYLVELFIPKSE